MKKLLFVLSLAFCFAFFSVAYADGLTEADFMGAWADVYDTSDGGATMEFFYLREDHTLFYVNRRFEGNTEGFGRVYIGSWSVNGDAIHIVYGVNIETDVYMTENYLLIPAGGDQYYTYGKVPLWADKDKKEDRDLGIAIPQGEYQIGTDIPAGKYTIDAGDADRITVYIYPTEKTYPYDYYYIGTREKEISMVANLQEGGHIKIDGATVYLSPFKGFDFSIFGF